ncbi:hypothetical protein BH09ACT5_BH09ACT5_25160 [soil metagenome]
MAEPDESDDDEAATQNRNDTRSAVTITIIALLAVLLAGILVVLDGVAP